MNSNAFLVDVSTTAPLHQKYAFLYLVFELMIDAVLKTGDQDYVGQITAELKDGEIVEIIDLFQEAFSDIVGLRMTGIARTSIRLFSNIKGIEISVWTATDELYTIFAKCDISELMNTLPTVSHLIELSSVDLKHFFKILMSIAYVFVFPPLDEVGKKYIIN